MKFSPPPICEEGASKPYFQINVPLRLSIYPYPSHHVPTIPLIRRISQNLVYDHENGKCICESTDRI